MKKRSEINSINLAATILFIASMLAIVIIWPRLTGNAINTVNPPNDCSEINVKALWDSVFKESSNNIIYSTHDENNNGVCDYIIATKNNSQTGFVLYYFKEEPVSYLLVKKTKFNSSSIGYANITNILSYENLELPKLLAIVALSAPSEDVINRTSKLNTAALANLTFLDAFKMPTDNINDLNWQYGNLPSITPIIEAEMFNKTDSYISNSKNITRIITGTVYSDKEDVAFVYSTFEARYGCVPNWTQRTQNKTSEDVIITYYLDENSCQNTSSRPSNSTAYYDFDKNNIIGNLSSLKTGLEIKINSTQLNISQIYNTTQIIEIKENSITRVIFNYSFASTLNLYNINITKQATSSNYSYLIVNGLEYSKTIFLDRLNTSNNVICIKNRVISDISEISSNCTSNSEYILSCPGSNSSYSCNITSSFYSITGLTNSAAREFALPKTTPIINCTPNWSCSGWNTCTDSQQIRICTDSNNCNSSEAMPTLSQPCVSCIPSWQCGNFTPKKCPKTKNQTRECREVNSCNPLVSTRTDQIECEYKPILSSKLLMIISLTIAIIVIVALIIYFITKKEDYPQATIDANNYVPQNNFRGPPGSTNNY